MHDWATGCDRFITKSGKFPLMTRWFNPFRRSQSLMTAAFWVPLFCFGGSSLIQVAPTYAQQNLPQPRIFDELPPPSSFPSPSSIPTFNVPTSPSPPVPSNTPPNPIPPEREFNFQAPPSPIPPREPTRASNLYRVDIDGDSSFVLSQVRQIEPQAFVRRGEGVIQAGVFTNAYNAESRVRVLAERGIRAQVTPITGGMEAGFREPMTPFTPGTDAGLENSERLLSNSLPDSVASRGYFVVIPGDRRNLPNLAAEVIQLGVSESAVNQREAPRGPHVAVGPFDSRKEADRWSNYFQSLGMDARVYFGN